MATLEEGKSLPIPPHSLIIRPSQMKAVIGLSRAMVYRLEAAGKFPRRRKLGENSVGWLRSEVEEWLKSREAA